jgi:ElaB/YqjD/DUF883 family membrane-anchored ribosome-binding protein
MERNDNLGNLGDTSATGQGGMTGAGATAGTGGFGAPGAGSSGGVSGGEGLTDRAKDVADDAKERISEVGSTVRDRAGQAKNSLADALEAGAERLRNRGGGQQVVGATGYGETTVTGDGGKVAQLGERVAGGLQSSADWLREADLGSLRQGVEKQVRENPGRTLLIAVGLGYLLGKAFRR